MNKLFVFEGPDQIGKSSIIKSLEKDFNANKIKYKSFSFPGNEPGKIGNIVYSIHHNPSEYNLKSINPISLQTLHVASHIDIIETQIKPALNDDFVILLDRFWWSTIVYGKIDGINQRVLNKLINLEKTIWDTIIPACIFLVDRKFDIKNANYKHEKVWKEYLKLSNTNKAEIIENDNIALATSNIKSLIMKILFPAKNKLVPTNFKKKGMKLGRLRNQQ